MFDLYTDDARQALAIAKEEAAHLGSPYIEAEHLLLGISRSSKPELREPLMLRGGAIPSGRLRGKRAVRLT
jgi:Clp amino terminal domain, pathogenicity island component